MNDMRYSARNLLLLGAVATGPACGLEHLIGGLVDTEHQQIVSTIKGTTTNSPTAVVVLKPDGNAVEPVRAAITGQTFTISLPSTEYTNSRVVATAGENRQEIVIPVLGAASEVTVALGGHSTAQTLVLDAALSGADRGLQLVSPGVLKAALKQVDEALGTAEGVDFEASVNAVLAAADPAGSTRVLRAPDFDEDFAAVASTLDPAWLAAHPAVGTTTTTFDQRLGALARGINTEACLDPVNLRVVLETDFNDGRKDGNCDVISRFKWVRDEPGKSMFFVGGFHEESPVQDPVIDASMGNSGGWVPNTVPMYDDGTHGDAVAGDNVWTFTILLPRNARIGYKYTWGTQGALWTGSEEWPGNQHILEIVDVNGDNIVYRRDNFGDEASNKDKANLNRRGRGSVTWDTDVNGDGVPDARERPPDLDNDCMLDEWQSPKGIGPATVDCE